jgi:hypothetical protein
MRDYWEESGMVFVTLDKRYGVTASLRTICLGEVVTDGDVPAETPHNGTATPEPPVEPSEITGRHISTPAVSVTDNSGKACAICGSPVPGKRQDRAFCSARCRQVAHRGRHLALAGVK